MLCKDIIKIIEQDYSPRYALSWDNVGLLAGRDDKEVAKIYVALDATDEVDRKSTRLNSSHPSSSRMPSSA